MSPHFDIRDTLVVVTDDGNMVGWKIPRNVAAMAQGRSKNEHFGEPD